MSTGDWFCLTVLLATVLVSFPVNAKKTSRPASPGDDYISALSTANRFLMAWQTQDSETGLVMLTDTAKRATSPDRAEKFLSPGAKTRRAYQIAAGKKIQGGRYAFPVALLETTDEQSHKPIHPRWSHLIVIQTGKDEWAIDKLP